MEPIFRPLAVMVAAGALMSVSPAKTPTYTPELLAHLDPSNNLAGLCGGGEASGSMRSKLMLAAAVVQAEPTVAAAQLYDGLGSVHLPITNANPTAQLWFNQGLSFAYGFNHAAAIASFREAQRLDPSCALCFWGEALAHGPNINAPMDAAANARAVGLARYANWLARNATPMEKALTAAMLKRYSPDQSADRAALDAAYADAMPGVAKAFPANDDVLLLAAESAMNTLPWNYWAADKTPNPRIGESIEFVEMVLARSPGHPQAAHLYIHLMENGPDPNLAEAAADRLAAGLAPDSGHLVHMPAHIYLRLGRWQDSIRLNLQAARADEEWIEDSGDTGLVRYGYYPHNVHFIVTSAQMAGDMPTAIREARRLDRLLDPKVSSKIAWIQAIEAAPYFAAAQFATPAQILAMAPPDKRLLYPAAMRHYARAVARANQRNRAGFDRELAKLRTIRASDGLKPMVDQGVPATDLLQIAEHVALGRWAFAGGRFDEAARHYREAIAVEARIPYMEPPFWYYPVHQSLGAALYRAKHFEEARDSFAAALAQTPNNGWALFGLAASEKALGRDLQSAAAEQALKKAWAGDPRWLRIDRL